MHIQRYCLCPKEFWSPKQKTNKLSDSYNRDDKCCNPTSSRNAGGHLPWGRWEGRRRKVWFFQEEGAASAKTGHTRTIIHLRTCKVFLCSWSTECKWRNGQKWGWRGKQIKRLYGHDTGSSHSPKSQGEQLQEFQQKCDLTPFGLEKN